MSLLTLKDIQNALPRVYEAAQKTPMELSKSASKLVGTDLHLKFENHQRTGSFKIRGSYNKISQLKGEGLHVAACSAGNHAQGVALSASLKNFHSHIVMPESAPIAKVQATKAYGAEVILHGQSFDEAKDHCQKLVKQNNWTFIHPYDDFDVMAGQGSLGVEIFDQCPSLTSVVIPVGGGGLISGVATAFKALNPKIKIYGVVSERAASMKGLFDKSNKTAPLRPTIADGIAIKYPSESIYKNYIEKLVDDIVEVSEEEIAMAMVFLLERAKTLVEGSGAASFAGALKLGAQKLGPESCALLCGGNVDLNLMASIIDKGMSERGRLGRVRVVVDDMPGRLNQLTQIIATYGANVLDVQHSRLDPDVHIRETAIEFLIATKDSDHFEDVKNALIGLGAK